jgi:NAD(P)-dependent dehydrogenase (short-subunit alcohol dehydrogenase family)
MEQVSFSLDGKVALVTGGTSGIGRTIAERLQALGASVVTCARHPPASPLGHFIAADLRQLEQIDAVMSETMDRLGRMDILVNNAGGSPEADAATASPRFSTAIIQLNLLAPLHFAQRANSVMQKQDDGGLILNIASVSGIRPSPGTAAYGAAKAGLLNLTQSLAVEWAPKVRLNAVVAGPILTEKAALHYGDGEAQAAVAQTIPMGRLGTPEDVADACVLFASPLARFLTGASLLVHGGGERPAFLGARDESARTPPQNRPK